MRVFFLIACLVPSILEATQFKFSFTNPLNEHLIGSSNMGFGVTMGQKNLIVSIKQPIEGKKEAYWNFNCTRFNRKLSTNFGLACQHRFKDFGVNPIECELTITLDDSLLNPGLLTQDLEVKIFIEDTESNQTSYLWEKNLTRGEELSMSMDHQANDFVLQEN